MLQRTFSLVATAVSVTVMAVSAYAQPAGTPVLWLDATESSTIDDDSGLHPGDIGFNSSNVQKWRDKSGSGYVFENKGLSGNPGADTDPSWNGSAQNGKAGIEFRNLDALTDETAGIPSGLPTGADARRVFAAVIPRSVTGQGSSAYFNYGNAVAGQWNNMFFYDSGFSGGPSYNYFAGNSRDMASNTKHNKTHGTAYVVEFAYDGNVAGEWFTNGTSDQGSIALAEPLATELTNARLGRELNQAGGVDLLELIVYNEGVNGALSNVNSVSAPGFPDSRQATGNYLAVKWDIATSYVPEPSTVLLLMLGVTALLFGRRRC